MLSIFYTNFAILLVLYSVPLFRPSDSLSAFSHYGFHWKIIWTTVVSFVITFLLHYPLVYHLKRNRKKICWILLIFLITLAMLASLILGFWVPYITSLLWLTSLIAGLFIYVFLLENLVLIFENLTKTQADRIRYLLENISLKSVENQREKLYRAFGKYSLRPYFEHLYKPLDIDNVKEIKHRAMMKEKLHYIFEDIIMIVTYILLLYLLIFLHKDPMISVSNEEMNGLIAGEHSRTRFDSSRGKYGILDYIENTLIFSLHSPVWYGRFASKDPGMTVDNSNKYVGRARLRQHRSGESPCREILRDFVCVSRFSERPVYRSFSESWRNDSESDRFARMDSAWKYRDAGTSPYIGEIDSYPGGGYVLPLGRTLKNSLTNFRYSKRHRWFDRSTRSLFVEFLAYTANANILNSVTVAFEVGLTGYVRMKREVITARLLLVGDGNALLWLVTVPFFLIVVILALKSIRNIIKNKLLWLKDAWCLMDASIVLMTIACAVLYAKRSTSLGEFLDEIERAKRNVFVNYFHLFRMEKLLTITSAMLVFLATFRLWKLLRFMCIIRVVEKTLSLSRYYLISVFICHFHLIVVFTVAGFLLFGDDSEDFNRLTDSFVSLILASIGFFSFDFDAFESPLHYFYFIAFVSSTMLIGTVYVAIISISFAESKNFYSNYREYNVVDFIREYLDYYKECAVVKWKKLRLKGGEDAPAKRLLVYPKSDEERYADSLRIDRIRMERMRQLARNVLRNVRIGEPRMNDDDVRLIGDTVAALRAQNEENVIYFIDKTAGRTRFVDNQTLLDIEKSLNNAYCRISNEDSFRDDANKRIDTILRSIEVVSKGLESIVFD
ncbi:unnamed protein product [Phyllotreta striolata]|uniref:Uncharacterized protein n=1 Tax=Phyllotreta striolata TaxID=444603 RepID=A0A9P0GW38_PHYSR|nr:unnamed protein product [Phyllotreta striolata]